LTTDLGLAGSVAFLFNVLGLDALVSFFFNVLVFAESVAFLSHAASTGVFILSKSVEFAHVSSRGSRLT